MTTFFKRMFSGEQYPRQMWILFWGTLISMTAQSLVWPFLTIFIRQQLGLPLMQITLLFTLQSIATMIATAAAGPAVDRFGRKGSMIIGTIMSSAALVIMSKADTYLSWAVILCFYAASGVLFRLGSQAMVADMIEPGKRTEAYALLRTASNTGIAIGPAVGGFVITLSYTISFYTAAVVQIGLAVVAAFMIQETLTDEIRQQVDRTQGSTLGYGPLLRDRTFMSFWSVYLLFEMAAALVFTLLAVYIKEQYSIPENQFGFILGTNAAMVVVFQYSVSRVSKRYRPLPVMAISGIFYALGMATFALGSTFFTFWLGIVIMTTGELLLSPTATALVADLAPTNMRGRYMGLFGLSYRIGGGIGPVFGGWLSDTIAPAATWYFGMVAALMGAGGFALLRRSEDVQQRRHSARAHKQNLS